MKQVAVIGILLLFAGNSIAGRDETFSSEEAKFKITFPDEFESKVTEEEGMTVVSLSCTYQNMIFLCSAFIYDEVIPKDEYALKISEGIVVTADAFNSKIKQKKCVHWNGAGNDLGIKNRIKGKVANGEKGKFKFYGNIYITMAYGIEYRITALSISKQGFDPELEAKFVDSFQLL